MIFCDESEGVDVVQVSGGYPKKYQKGFPINGLDKAVWDTQNGLFYQYSTADFSMNGDIDGGDKSLWSANNGIASVISK